MNPETNPYIPAAGSRPPVLAGREEELDTFTVALGRLGKGVHARSMILDGVRGVGKTVLLREFNYIAREQGWITSGVVECDEGEQLPRIVAKLCHRALRDLDKRWKAGQAMRRAFGVLKAFTFTLDEGGKWRFNIDFDAIKGVADSGDPEADIVELLGEVGKAASEHGEGVLLLLDEMVRHEALPGSCGVRDPTAGLSRQPGEAEGSLTPELWGRAGSSPDNDVTHGDYRTVRVRLARRTVCDESEPVIEPPQARHPGSNPMDMGWASGVWEPASHGTRPTTGSTRPSKACGEWPRDRHTKPAGEKLDTDPVKRTAVNVGTRPMSPRPLLGAGKTQRPLMALGGGVAPVVVAGVTTGLGGRESRLQGEGEQWACSPTGTRGGRR
jgi:AAA ATPase domain